MLLAAALSFLFFAGYEQLFFKNRAPEQNGATAQYEKTEQQTPVKTQKIENEIKAEKKVSPSGASAVGSKIIAKVNSKFYDIKIDSLGRIKEFYLNDEKYKSESGEKIQLFNAEKSPLPLEIRFGESSLNQEAFDTPYVADVEEISLDGSPKKIILTQKLSNLSIKKEIIFYPSGKYTLNVSLSSPKEYFVTPGFRPDALIDQYTFHGVIVREADETLTMIDDGDAEDGSQRLENATFVAASDRYYTTTFYDFKNGLDVYISKDKESNPLLFIAGKQNISLNGYMGPKEHNVLSSIDKRLTDIIEYGFITAIARYVFLFLQFLESIFGNWGWAIVATTIIIRLVLFPLTYKGMLSMNKLKELAPKIKDMKERYGSDKQKLHAHTMELYKKHNANPMGGCFPMLMQIPVFFAIYRVLLNAIELKSSSWALWITDLSLKDPYYVLPVLMGITMFWQQRITPNNFTDPTQEKIMKFLPVPFTFIFAAFPAGLTLYWFVNNLFSVAQQYYVNSLFEKKKAKK